MAPRPSASRKNKQRVVDSDDESDGQQATDYDSDAPPATKKQKGKGKAKASTQQQKKGKGKGKKKQQDSSDEEDEDSDDDVGPAQKKGALREEERKELVAAMTRHILFTEYTRKLHPRKALADAVLTEPHTKKRFNDIIPGVQKTLRELLGMELVKMRPKESSNAKNPTPVYVLRSTLPVELQRAANFTSHSDLTSTPDEDLSRSSKLARELAKWEEDSEAIPGLQEEGGAPLRDVKREEGAAYGLLGVILGLILVNGKVLGDDQLITYLRRLSLTPSSFLPLSLSAAHPDALTLAKYIDLLVTQGYIERGPSAAAPAAKGGRLAATQRTQRGSGDNRVEGGDPAIEYHWGARAEIEIGELGIAKFMQQVWEWKAGGEDEDEEEEGGAAAAAAKKGKTGEKFLSEIARAAGTAELDDAAKLKVTL